MPALNEAFVPVELRLLRLDRAAVIRLTGSAARLQYTPPPPRAPQYWGYGRCPYAEGIDDVVLLALHLSGLSSTALAVACGVTRQAIEKRLAKFREALGTPPGRRGGPVPQQQRALIRRLVRAARSDLLAACGFQFLREKQAARCRRGSQRAC